MKTKHKLQSKRYVRIPPEEYLALMNDRQERNRLLVVIQNPDGAVQRKFSRLFLKLAEHIQNNLWGRTIRSDMLAGFFLRQRENKKLIMEIMREP